MLISLFAIFAGCFVLERLLPGWPLPSVKTWPWQHSCGFDPINEERLPEMLAYTDVHKVAKARTEKN